LRRAFISIDKNGDGTLSKEELAAAFEASDIDLTDLDTLI